MQSERFHQPIDAVGIFTNTRVPNSNFSIPSSGWIEETAYNPNTQKAYKQASAPNARKLICALDTPESKGLYDAFLSDVYRALGEDANLDGLFPSDEITWLSYEVGDSVVPHRDDGGVIRTEQLVKRAKYTALWYFSTEDLKGGELLFPERGIAIPATNGSQVVFDAHEIHQVAPVVQGTRFVLMLRLWSRE